VGATLFKKVDYSLAKLVHDIDMGDIGLPDIQRPFVWSNTKVRNLFDSMYKGFPVGYLLFWASSSNGHKQVGAESKQKVPRLLIVDGQQRLTSLYAVIKGVQVVREDWSKEHIRIAFRPRDRVFEVADAAIRRDPEWIPDISRLWMGKPFKFVTTFIEQLRGRREVSEDEADLLADAIDQVYDLQNYPFTALELSSVVDEEQVAEVFVRINSEGTLLKQADFILTLMSVFWDEGRAALERFSRESRQPALHGASPFNYFIQPDPDDLLRVEVALGFGRARLQHVYSILRGKDLETGEFSDERRDQQFAILRDAQDYAVDLTNWHEFLKALLRAGYRKGEMITSKLGALYSYAMFLIGRRLYGVDLHDLKNSIARWFFMVALTARYTGSPETIMEQDLGRLSGAEGAGGFRDFIDAIVKETLTGDYWGITLPAELASSSARTPALSSYYAALNLLDARVLFSKLKVSELLDPAAKAKKAAVERHHLFPRGYLGKLEITKIRDVNQIANFALVEWPDNIAISDDPPSEYFGKLAHRLSDEDRYWHALPDGWENMPYEEFLPARRKLMARVIRDGFSRLVDQSGA
jgi:hypothetical protein